MPTMTIFQPVSMRTIWRIGLTLLVAIAWLFACSGLSPYPMYQAGILVVWFFTARALCEDDELREEAPAS